MDDFPPDGKFDLILSFPVDADELVDPSGAPETWREACTEASELLHAATNGQHQLGTVYFAYRRFGDRTADFQVYESSPTGEVPRYNSIENNEPGFLGADDYAHAFDILHELGHYAYGLGDEYPKDTFAYCNDEAASCIMENQPGTTEFCMASNHDQLGESSQQTDWNGESCWNTMQDAYGLEIPPGTGYAPANAHEAVSFVDLRSEYRMVLVLDRSGSMTGEAIETALLGASSLIGLTQHDGQADQDHFALVTYADDPVLEMPMQQMQNSDQRTAFGNALTGIGAGGRTAMGDALRVAIDTIENYGDRAAVQAIVLLSDGYHNAGVENPSDMLAELRQKGISVFSIGVGPAVDADLMRELATETRGEFAWVEPDEIAGQIQEFYFALHPTEGFTGIEEETLSQDEPPQENDEQEAFMEYARSFAAPAPAFYSKILETMVERGAKEVTFFASHQGKADGIDLLLRSPAGELYSVLRGDLPPKATRILGDGPHLGVRIRGPETDDGEWLSTVPWLAMVIGPAPVRFRYLASARHPGVSLGVRTDKLRYESGDAPKLFGMLRFDLPLARVRWRAVLVNPAGKRFEVDLEPVEPAERRGWLPTNYQAVLPRLRRPGQYRLHVTAWTTEKTAYGNPRWWRESPDDDDPADHEDDPRRPIPPLRRSRVLAFQVGAPPSPRVFLDPRIGRVPLRPGASGKVVIRRSGSTPLPRSVRVRGGPQLGLGAAMRDDGGITVEVTAAEQARPGPRDLVLEIGGQRHVLESAVEILPPEAFAETRASIDGHVRSIRFPRPGEMVFTLETDRGSAELRSDRQDLGRRLQDAAAAGVPVHVEQDPETGRILSVEPLTG